jgi:FKBP-type peptidyl-prolyl cis-trans isomerase FklB
LRGVEKIEQIDTTLLFKGFSEGLIGADTTYLSSEDQKLVNREFEEGLRAKMTAQIEQEYGSNKSAGELFLASNTTKPGVITTESGLQYEVIEQGSGAKAGVRDNVECHYHGTLLDGTVFDSSVDRKKTNEFNVSGVIRGWTEVLQLMNVGSKYRVYVPQELAYGANPRPGGPIQPYSTLIFYIELIAIK